MPAQRSQQQLPDHFAAYASPQKVNMYRMWGVDFIPGRREGVRVWDHDGGRSWIDCRSARGGFHLGHRPARGLAATAACGAKSGPLAPGFRRVPFGDFEALQAAVTDDVAAVIMETIPATAGFTLPPDDWYPRIRRLCDERSVIMILDEVQAGLGRTGRPLALGGG